MMKRREFIRNAALFPLSALSTNDITHEAENVLEYAKVEITFPSLKRYCKSSEYILQQTLEALSRWENDEIMLHFHDHDGSVYNIEIDELLCSDSIENKAYLDYPSIILFANDKKLLLPNLSLFTTVKYPQIMISNKDQRSFSRSLPNLSKLGFDFLKYPIESLRLSICGDIEYVDVNRPDKLFNLHQFNNHKRTYHA